MRPDLETINAIQNEKQKDVGVHQIPEIDAEIKTLAERKRFTFDIVQTPVDPLR